MIKSDNICEVFLYSRYYWKWVRADYGYNIYSDIVIDCSDPGQELILRLKWPF